MLYVVGAKVILVFAIEGIPNLSAVDLGIPRFLG